MEGGAGLTRQGRPAMVRRHPRASSSRGGLAQNEVE